MLDFSYNLEVDPLFHPYQIYLVYKEFHWL